MENIDTWKVMPVEHSMIVDDGKEENWPHFIKAAGDFDEMGSHR